MKKNLFAILASLTFFNTITNATLSDAIAIVVNNKPITLYEIDAKTQEEGINAQEAVQKLINDLLYKDELLKQNISADIFEVETYVERLAKRENMSSSEYKSAIKQRYANYEAFLDQIRKQITHEKFIAKVARTNLKMANDEDLKMYYENNLNKFQRANSFEITQYVSKNKNDLGSLQKNPLKKFDGIEKTSLTLTQKELNDRVKQLLNETKEGSFTPIFIADKEFSMMFINKKNGVEQIPFENVKEKIFEVVMGQREDAFIKEYFDKIRLSAKIEIKR